MLRISNAGLVVASTLLVTLLVVNAGISYQNTVKLGEDAQSDRRSRDVIESIHATRAAVKQAGAGQQACILAADPDCLGRYRSGVAELDSVVARLSAQLAQDGGAEAHLSELLVRMRSGTSELQRTIALLETSGFDEGSRRALAGSGSRAMAELDSATDELQGHVSTLLLMRSERAQRTFRMALISEMATAGVSMLLIVTALLLIRRNLDARTRAAFAVAEQSDVLRTTLGSIVEGIVVTDAEGRVSFMNRAAEQMAGRKLAEVDGQPISTVFDVRDEASRMPVASTAVLAMRKGAVPSLTNRRVLIGRNGQEYAVEDSAAPLVDRAGKVLGAVLAVRDVTQQRRSERAIADARIFAESIVDTIPDPLVILEPSLRVRSANRRCFEMFATTEAELVGRSLLELGGGGWDEDKLRGLLERVEGTEDLPARCEVEHAVPGAGMRILRLNARHLAGIGEDASLVMLVIRDVTESRANERRVKQLLQAEQLNADRWRQIAAASSTLNSAHSRDGVLAILREEARRILGSEEALISLDPLAPPDASAWLSAPLTGPGGRTLGHLSLRGVARRTDGSGESDPPVLRQLVHVASVAIENACLYEELREGDRRKDEFLATLAHELRNPLAPMRNSLQVLRARQAGEEDREKALATIERQVTLLVRLVDDLLDVSRITRGKITIKRETIDLAEVVGQALEISRPIIHAAGTTLAVSLPQERIMLYVDPARIAQVLSNLLNNAAKYTERGGHIWLACTTENEEAVIRVRDDGIGISAEMLPHIFDMFWQIEHALERAQGGLGIGLTLVRQLVELHGGSAEAHSPGPGRGSEFVVRLPARMVAGLLGPGPVPVAQRAPKRLHPGLGILVVDDNEDSAESLALLLRLQGNEVRTAHDGLQALRVEFEFRPQLVLLDIGLPKMNGYEAARELRSRRGRELTLVAMTGWGQDNDRRRSQEAGFDHHLVKPVDPGLLREILESAHAPRG